MKLITLHYPSFDGLLSYTGVAKERLSDPEDTADYLMRWLQETEGMRFFQVIEHLRGRASTYIADIERRTGDRQRLTLIATAFVGNNAQTVVISNFENVHGYIASKALPQLEIDWEAYRPGYPPVVLITGNKGVVTKELQQDLITAIIDAGEDSGRIRNEISLLNRLASRRSAAKDTISEGCTVVSMDSSGSGNQDIELTPGLSVRHVHNGHHLSIEHLLSSMGAENATVVGAAFGTSKPAMRKPVNCKRSVSDPGDSRYTLTEIVHCIDLDCTAFGIATDGTVFGSHSTEDNRAYSRYWFSTENGGLSYIDIDPTMHNSGCMSANGHTALVGGDREQPTVMALMVGTPGSHQLEVPSGMGEPQLSAINDTGSVCGAIAINRDNRDPNRERPAFWDERGSLYIAEDLKNGTRGRAVHINRSGKVLVWSAHGMWGRICLIWDPIQGTTTEIPGEIIPTFLTDSGVVLGFDRRAGRDAAIVSYDQATWTKLRLNDGFSPSICDNSLTIGGNVRVDGYSRIWLMRPGGHVDLLPVFEYHHAFARALNDSGVVVGGLTTDNEQHVAVWVPPRS